MIQGYFDGSGTHEGSKVLVIAGFIGGEEAFVDLDQHWERVLDDPRWPTRLSEFHTVDCVHGVGEFQRAAWSYAERLALYGSLTRLIVEVGERHILLPIGAGVVAGIFDEIAKADLDLREVEGLGTPFDLTFQLLLQQIIHRAYERWPHEEIGLLYDKGNKPEADRFRALFNEYAGRFYRETFCIRAARRTVAISRPCRLPICLLSAPCTLFRQTISRASRSLISRPCPRFGRWSRTSRPMVASTIWKRSTSCSQRSGRSRGYQPNRSYTLKGQISCPSSLATRSCDSLRARRSSRSVISSAMSCAARASTLLR